MKELLSLIRFLDGNDLNTWFKVFADLFREFVLFFANGRGDVTVGFTGGCAGRVK